MSSKIIKQLLRRLQWILSRCFQACLLAQPGSTVGAKVGKVDPIGPSIDRDLLPQFQSVQAELPRMIRSNLAFVCTCFCASHVRSDLTYRSPHQRACDPRARFSDRIEVTLTHHRRHLALCCPIHRVAALNTTLQPWRAACGEILPSTQRGDSTGAVTTSALGISPYRKQ